ncbi:MAG: cytochrome c maturation protein CcmE [Eggerthellaceae bacterium]|nr:cytochrome c maturation protein CcmE [Eggerthellaceae bacterium]
MNTRTKRRLIVVSGIIIIVLIVVLALVGGNTAATNVSVAQALSGEYENKKIQVSGNVVEDSFSTQGNTLTFAIYDPEGDKKAQLQVSFDGGVSATFGNDVTAICTGRIDSSGVLQASELVTKCPSKYTSASDALSVSRLFEYGDEIIGKPVKVTGTVKAGSLTAAGQGDRFVLVDPEGTPEISVTYLAALPDEVQEGSTLVVTGSLDTQGKFAATDVALEG